VDVAWLDHKKGAPFRLCALLEVEHSTLKSGSGMMRLLDVCLAPHNMAIACVLIVRDADAAHAERLLATGAWKCIKEMLEDNCNASFAIIWQSWLLEGYASVARGESPGITLSSFVSSCCDKRFSSDEYDTAETEEDALKQQRLPRLPPSGGGGGAGGNAASGSAAPSAPRRGAPAAQPHGGSGGGGGGGGGSSHDAVRGQAHGAPPDNKSGKRSREADDAAAAAAAPAAARARLSGGAAATLTRRTPPENKPAAAPKGGKGSGVRWDACYATANPGAVPQGRTMLQLKDGLLATAARNDAAGQAERARIGRALALADAAKRKGKSAKNCTLADMPAHPPPAAVEWVQGEQKRRAELAEKRRLSAAGGAGPAG
jgi:hypothetical protein